MLSFYLSYLIDCDEKMSFFSSTNFEIYVFRLEFENNKTIKQLMNENELTIGIRGISE